MDIYAFTPAPTPETQVLHEKSSERTRASQRSLLDSRGQPDEPTLRFGKWEASTENGRVVSSVSTLWLLPAGKNRDGLEGTRAQSGPL